MIYTRIEVTVRGVKMKQLLLLMFWSTLLGATALGQGAAAPTNEPASGTGRISRLQGGALGQPAGPGVHLEEQSRTSLLRPLPQEDFFAGHGVSTEPLIWAHRALYVRLWDGGLLVPAPGGGASGCFSLDLPERIARLRLFVKTLESLPPRPPEQTHLKN